MCGTNSKLSSFFYEGLYKMHFYFLTLNFYHFKTLVEKNKWMIGERKARTWVRLDTVLRTFPRYWLKTSHEMLRLICLLISVHKRCDIVCTIHLVLNLRFSLLLVLSHVTIVSCGKKKSLLFFLNKDISLDKKSLFFKCTDILLQNWASYFLRCSSIVVLYILLKQTDISCNFTEMLLTFMLFSMTVLFK